MWKSFVHTTTQISHAHISSINCIIYFSVYIERHITFKKKKIYTEWLGGWWRIHIINTFIGRNAYMGRPKITGFWMHVRVYIFIWFCSLSLVFFFIFMCERDERPWQLYWDQYNNIMRRVIWARVRALA